MRPWKFTVLAWAIAAAPTLPALADESFDAAAAALQRATASVPNTEKARGVVLFVGDGMDVSTVTAARIFAGQRTEGASGEDHALSWEGFPYVSLAKTYNTNQQVPDSAGTATALLTGSKTSAGVIGVGSAMKRGKCDGLETHRLESLFELAEAAGLSTGVVTTTRITHATPAAAYAHGPERGWEIDAAIPPEEAEKGCTGIARQLVEPGPVTLEVALGGGLALFLPEARGGRRTDGRDLTKEWTARGDRFLFVSSAQDLSALPAGFRGNLLGLFAPSHIDYRAGTRGRSDARAGSQPSLPEMTDAALRILARNPKGYLLLVEAGRVDHAHHEGNAYRALDEAVELSDTVARVVDQVDSGNVLLVVTADHGHTMSLSGYPTRGNPILGTVRTNDAHGAPLPDPLLAADGKAFTTLGYMNGPGAISRAPDPEGESAPLERPEPVGTTHPDYLQQSLYPLEITAPGGFVIAAETHGGQDVPIWAQGPWAHLFQGTVEQNYVFHVMRRALALEPPAP